MDGLERSFGLGKQVDRFAIARSGREARLFRASGQIVVAHPPFRCAKTVSELHLFVPLGLLFERKQIPQIVVNIRISRNPMEPLEATRLPWAQGVGRSNRPAPTNEIKWMWPFPATLKLAVDNFVAEESFRSLMRENLGFPQHGKPN